MNKMFLIAVAMCFMFVGEASAQKGRRWRQQEYVPQVTYVQPPAWVTPSTNVSKVGEVCEDALAEVNAERAKRGLKPYIHDPLLAKAALECAKQRASRLIHGHLPESDFTYLPKEVSVNGVVGGCAAWADGFGACAMYDNYTYCGASWVRGSDGLKYCQIA
jgi:hypothetical protein